MKKLPIPNVRDNGFIDELSDNPLLSATSYPHLKRGLAAVKNGYQNYDDNHGNVWGIASLKLSDNLEAATIVQGFPFN